MSISCFLRGKDALACGSSRGIEELSRLLECKDDIRTHLATYHLSWESVSEYELILARSGFFDTSQQQIEELWICPIHRHRLGKFWKESRTTCQHPKHCGVWKQVKGRDTAGFQMAKEIMMLYKANVPVGSRICSTCRKKHKTQIEGEDNWIRPPPSNNFENESVLEKTTRQCKIQAEHMIISCMVPATPMNLMEHRQRSGVIDNDWTPSQWTENSIASPNEECVTQRSDVLGIYNDAFTRLSLETEVGEVVPLESRLGTKWEKTSKKDQNACIDRATEACRVVCGVIAPKDGEKLFEAMKNTNAEVISEELRLLMTAHRDAPTRNLKTQILSIYAYRFSAKKLIELHQPYGNVTNWQIKRARAHANNVGPGEPLNKDTHHRVRIDKTKLDHFIEFINRPYFYQDVSYGTRKLRLDNGETITMPNIIRTVTRSTIIAQYVQHCKEDEFSPLSERTMYRVLKVREASERKSLQGLDNIAADGTAAFITLENIIDDLEQAGIEKTKLSDLRRRIRENKNYLKTEYKVHCKAEENECADHCRKFGLSDPHDTDVQCTCSHRHNMVCPECEDLKKLFIDIKALIENLSTRFYNHDQKDDLLYDLEEAQNLIFEWKAHTLRSINQEAAKEEIVENLDENSALVVMDWAMKFLQSKYREKQSDWFAKRGLSWHISSVICKGPNGEIQVFSYAHLFDTCTQDWYAVTSIVENLLQSIKDDLQVKKVFLRSDEAGCYHNNYLIAAVRDIGDIVGVEVAGYHYSEPQNGKDICDRILCPMKLAIRKYCNEGHDILKARDMREALVERRVKGTTASVNTINETNKCINVKDIPNISTYHNFQYEKDGVRVWKAHGIGPGKLVKYQGIYITHQSSTGMCTSDGEHFQFQINDMREVKKKTQLDDEDETDTEHLLFHCLEPGCTLSFKSFNEYDLHTVVGDHTNTCQRTESVYNKVKRDWGKMFTTISLTAKNPTHHEKDANTGVSLLEGNACGTDGNVLSRGWALKQSKGSKPFPLKVKSYLEARYMSGEKTGHKADPAQVVVDMRTARNENGDRLFTRNEWLNATQIKGFFSRMTAKRRKQHRFESDIVLDDVDVECLEHESERNAQVEEILGQLAVKHPIVYDVYDLCEYYQKRKISAFGVKMLKEISKHFDLSFKSNDRKQNLISKIEGMVLECACNKDER